MGKKLSAKQLHDIIRLAEQGMLIREIARKLGLSGEAVRQNLPDIAEGGRSSRAQFRSATIVFSQESRSEREAMS